MEANIILKVLWGFLLAIRAHTNPTINLNINVNGALVMYIGLSKSNKRDPMPEARPPFIGPRSSADNKQKAFPKCIIVLYDPIGMNIFTDVPIRTSADIIPVRQILNVLFFFCMI